MKLRPSHYIQLLSYIEAAETEGWYYGNKKQFERRHEELKEYVDNLLKTSLLIKEMDKNDF